MPVAMLSAALPHKLTGGSFAHPGPLRMVGRLAGWLARSATALCGVVCPVRCSVFERPPTASLSVHSRECALCLFVRGTQRARERQREE